nr:hypothetical protein CFP56_36428 [Quercus suber]
MAAVALYLSPGRDFVVLARAGYEAGYLYRCHPHELLYNDTTSTPSSGHFSEQNLRELTFCLAPCAELICGRSLATTIPEESISLETYQSVSRITASPCLSLAAGTCQDLLSPPDLSAT